MSALATVGTGGKTVAVMEGGKDYLRTSARSPSFVVLASEVMI